MQPTQPALCTRSRHAGPAALSALVLLNAAGCLFPSYPNGPLDRYAPESGYRFESLAAGENNTDDLFVCLTFSGGGTRAASLAFGVLSALRETHLGSHAAPGAPRTLLNEVDMISGVSGGSFTALAYGLWGEGTFDGKFEQRFLRNDVQTYLIQALLNPLTLFRLMSAAFDRIDLAATYFDEEIFRHARYADLLKRATRPYIVVNATNLALEQRFEFTQDDFDLLGSDLASVPLGWAAAASSAVPILFSPLRLKYFAGQPVARAIGDVLDEQTERTPRRRSNWARHIAEPVASGESSGYVLDADDHRFLYLVDGGVVDNLGLAPIIDSLEHGPIARRLDRDEGRPPAIRRLVVVVVDAGTPIQEEIERLPSSPGILHVGFKSGMASIENTSEALLDLLRMILVQAPRRQKEAMQEYNRLISGACPDLPAPDALLGSDIERYLIVVSLREIADEEERRRFAQIPTSFFLPSKDVDDLIAAGRRLLQQNSEFQRLVGDLLSESASAVSAPTPSD